MREKSENDIQDEQEKDCSNEGPVSASNVSVDGVSSVDLSQRSC